MTNHVSTIKSLKIQYHVIRALFLREIITRYGRENIGFLWLFIEPMLITVIITLGWKARMADTFPLPITAFILTGYSSLLLWRNMVGRCTGAIQSNSGLLFHRNVRVLDVFYSRVLLELAGSTLSFIILAFLFTAIGWMDAPHDVLKVIWGWALLAWFGCALALVLGSLNEKYDFIEKLWTPFSFVMMPFTGLAFMLDWLPEETRQIFAYLPMIHAVELIREGYLGSIVHAHYDLNYFCFFCLCLTFVGLYLVSRFSNRVTSG